MPNQLKWFSDSLAKFKTQFILTVGNHDVEHYERYLPQFQFVQSYDLDGVRCVHESFSYGAFIAGHVHPGVT